MLVSMCYKNTLNQTEGENSMHLSKLTKCTSWLLAATVFGFGTMAFAADTDQQAPPDKTSESAPAKTTDSAPPKAAVAAPVKASEPVQNIPEVVAKVNGEEI